MDSPAYKPATRLSLRPVPAKTQATADVPFSEFVTAARELMSEVLLEPPAGNTADAASAAKKLPGKKGIVKGMFDVAVGDDLDKKKEMSEDSLGSTKTVGMNQSTTGPRTLDAPVNEIMLKGNSMSDLPSDPSLNIKERGHMQLTPLGHKITGVAQTPEKDYQIVHCNCDYCRQGKTIALSPPENDMKNGFINIHIIKPVKNYEKAVAWPTRGPDGERAFSSGNMPVGLE